MAVIDVPVPSDHTPEPDQQFVAEVAASHVGSGGSGGGTVEAPGSEEVELRTPGAAMTSRWAS